ncbi:glycosyltransferase [Stutzerimonas decontaminans]|uniref:Glycosyltransferase n=2 Tax=Stutzerimonas TaxID=2901164 RepID=A0ABX4VZC4_9GAMM|nr:glycosyltransferase [Stutzerimonas decontaminans]AHY41304.1 glycosyl transferase [Stutzerimonas decontaminans]MCQ4247422.1 glycosyltransferase [Stutzerimonas decontaminans]PNF85562.1 glycosyltransferase [Stutzerimonas decontaminans]
MTASELSPGQAQRWVLQFCHGYDGPFLDCARQYAALFVGTPYKVCTVYLTGAPSEEVVQGSASDEVIFLNYSSRDVRGLKLRAILDIRKLARTRNFAFCIAHRFKPIYVALLGTELPVIGVHHAFGDYQRRSRQLFANFYRKRLALLGVSNAVRDDIRACLPDWSAERIETLYNRIDIAAVQAEQVSKEEARAVLGLPQDVWVVGNVGRLHSDKDQATLIRGFALALPGLPVASLLVIAGSGGLEEVLKGLAAELGISQSVRFLGQVPHARRYFKAFDVFVLTSDHEPFGMVLLEAMAAGVPVACTDSGGGKEVVGGIGELFALKDEQELAATLERRANTGDTLQLRGMMAARLAEVFSDQASRKRFWNLSVLPAVKE